MDRHRDIPSLGVSSSDSDSSDSDSEREEQVVQDEDMNAVHGELIHQIAVLHEETWRGEAANFHEFLRNSQLTFEIFCTHRQLHIKTNTDRTDSLQVPTKLLSIGTTYLLLTWLSLSLTSIASINCHKPIGFISHKDFAIRMPVKVDLDELYPPKPRFLVFRHKECSAFWLGIGPDSCEVRSCAGCNRASVQAVASFATIDDAYEFRNNLIKLDKETKLQAGNVRLITEKLAQQKKASLDPNHMRLPEVDSRESAGRNGVMFRSWLFWDPEFPATQMPPHQNYISNSRVWHYQPNPNEWTIGGQKTKEEQGDQTEKK